MGLQPSGNTPSSLIEEYRSLYNSRQSETWKPIRWIQDKQTIVCAGAGPSLNAFRADKILEMGFGLITCNSAGVWAQNTGNDDWFVQIMTDSQRIFGKHADPAEVPTFVSPFYLTREWLDYVRSVPDYRVLLTSFDIFNESGREIARPQHLLFPSYDLIAEGINHCGQSVIFAAIQLAVHFGATRIILIGVDMDYSLENPHHIPGVDHRNPNFSYEDHSRPAFIAFRDSMRGFGVWIEVAGESKIDVLPKGEIP